jgi:Transposase DDE domain
MGMRGPATLVAYRWWDKATPETKQTSMILELTHSLALRYQQAHPMFVGDRGVGNRAILTQWVEGQVRFVVRFNEQVSLCATPDGLLQPVKQFLKRQRGRVTCEVYDTRLRRSVTVRLRWCPVWLPHQAQPLTLIIVRHLARHDSWRLVTTLPVQTDQQAIHIARIYARRWQVEWSLRFLKAELAIESPRLLIWERREKLMALVFLVYGWFSWNIIPWFIEFSKLNRIARADERG